MSNAAHTHDSHADTTATRRVTTETKSSYETTELIAYVVTVSPSLTAASTA